MVVDQEQNLAGDSRVPPVSGRALIVAAFSLLIIPALALAQPELGRVLNILLAPPKIVAASGFCAHPLVPPGQLYDPLFTIPRAERSPATGEFRSSWA